jgi:hypothetical protein
LEGKKMGLYVRYYAPMQFWKCNLIAFLVEVVKHIHKKNEGQQGIGNNM